MSKEFSTSSTWALICMLPGSYGVHSKETISSCPDSISTFFWAIKLSFAYVVIVAVPVLPPLLVIVTKMVEVSPTIRGSFHEILFSSKFSLGS